MILIDNTISRNPSYNLALEEALVRQKDDQKAYLLIYINDSSVIIGRHQNIYEEVNLKYCYDHNIPVLRRISGGGAVWHDSGNLNFSFINNNSAQLVNNYYPFLQPVISALKELGLNAEQSVNNDLFIDGKKICGTAQFTAKNRMLTHGTLLYNSDLNKANAALKSPLRPYFTSKSKKSRLSPITNMINFFDENRGIGLFKERLIKALYENKTITKRATLKNEILQTAAKLQNEQYRNWEWNYGRSPGSNFIRKTDIASIIIKVNKGRFSDVRITSNIISAKEINTIENLFNGKKYDILSITEITNRIKKLNKSNINWKVLLSE